MSDEASGWDEYLQEGETLLWEGRPDTRIFLWDRQEKYKHLLALIWVAFFIAFFNISGQGFVAFFQALLATNTWWVALIITIVFGYFLVGRWVLDKYQREKTVYALSDQRAFIARSDFGRRDMKTFNIVPDMPVKFKNEPLGAITFGPKPNVFQRNNKWIVDDGSFTFRGLRDAQAVLKIVADIQEEMEKKIEAGSNSDSEE